jgi:hypothetical protein
MYSPRPTVNGREFDLVFLGRLLDAGGLQVFQDDADEIINSVAVVEFPFRHGLSGDGIDEFIGGVDTQCAVG